MGDCWCYPAGQEVPPYLSPFSSNFFLGWFLVEPGIRGLHPVESNPGPSSYPCDSDSHFPHPAVPPLCPLFPGLSLPPLHSFLGFLCWPSVGWCLSGWGEGGLTFLSPVVLGLDPLASCVVGKCFPTELHPQPLSFLLCLVTGCTHRP